MSRVTPRQLEELLFDAAALLGKMDVAAKRTYLFALLLLKRSSDVFAEAWDREYAAELELTNDPDMALSAANDRDSYPGNQLFVPPSARWAGLVEDPTRLSARLNTALTELEKSNPDQEGVFGHIDFNKAPGGNALPNDTLRDLIRTLNLFSLTDANLEFPGMVGVVYESALRRFAEETGSGAGDHYTPREVVRLMVRLAAPAPGNSVYDPCAGSAGMLIHAREYVADYFPQQAGTVSLSGQELSTSQWVNARLNLLLHGIRDADVRLGDILTEPRHLVGASPKKFSTILSNPEFSQSYDAAKVAANKYDRFGYGDAPKQADLLFVQHMVASLSEDGVAITCMPHGVLFRAGKEQVIRKGLLLDDMIEAVIGLPPGIFNGSGIPACLLILRHPEAKPVVGRGKVLFINADREFTPGRVQNLLSEEHAEKIFQTYAGRREVLGFSRLVPVTDLLSDEANLNIRRWVDNTPAPEPQDVSAHLYGGVPLAEVAALRPDFTAFKMDPDDYFISLDDGFLGFPLEGADAAGRRLDAGASAVERAVLDAAGLWWSRNMGLLADLPATNNPMPVRTKLVDTFRAAMIPFPVLDEFTAIGLIASWWREHLEAITAWSAGGARRVVEGWAVSVETMLSPQRVKGGGTKARSAGERREIRDHPLVVRLLDADLRSLDDIEKAIAELDATIGGVLASTPEQLADAKKTRPDMKKIAESREWDLLTKLRRRVAALSDDDAEAIVLSVLEADLTGRLTARFEEARRALVGRYSTLAAKYGVSLSELERERDNAAVRLAEHLAQIGYKPRNRHSSDSSVVGC